MFTNFVATTIANVITYIANFVAATIACVQQELVSLSLCLGSCFFFNYSLETLLGNCSIVQVSSFWTNFSLKIYCGKGCMNSPLLTYVSWWSFLSLASGLSCHNWNIYHLFICNFWSIPLLYHLNTYNLSLLFSFFDTSSFVFWVDLSYCYSTFAPPSFSMRLQPIVWLKFLG